MTLVLTLYFAGNMSEAKILDLLHSLRPEMRAVRVNNALRR